MSSIPPPKSKEAIHLDTVSQSPDFLRGYRMALVHAHLGRFEKDKPGLLTLLAEIDRRLAK